MMLRLMMWQTKFLLRQKEAILTMILLIWLIMYNYIGNVLAFQGKDVSEMYNSMKLLTLSYNRINYNGSITLLFIMVYPFLAVMPAGFSYVKEQQTGEEVFMRARIGKSQYLIGKLGASFLTTMIVFLVPFMLEIIMNCVSFPLKAQGDLSNLGMYRQEYAEMVHRYPGDWLYMYSPVLYAVVGTAVFCALAGILGMFTVAVSFSVFVKYRVLLLLPVYLLLNGTTYLNRMITKDSARISWYEYKLLFNDSVKNSWYLIAGIGIILILITALSLAGMKKEKW